MITLDAALDQFRSDTSTENAEMLWSVANAYKDGDMLSKEGLHGIYEEVAAPGAFD
jgi:hypothetical protein